MKRLPTFIRIGVFFAGMSIVGAIGKLWSGFREGRFSPITWTDLGLYAVLWLVFSALYYAVKGLADLWARRRNPPQ